MAKEGFLVGDDGVVVERHEVAEYEPGYSLEFFDMLGNTVPVATLPASAAIADSSRQPAVRTKMVMV